jgi:hypothetical protein
MRPTTPGSGGLLGGLDADWVTAIARPPHPRTTFEQHRSRRRPGGRFAAQGSGHGYAQALRGETCQP